MKHFFRKVFCGLLSTAIIVVGITTFLPGLTAGAETTGSYIQYGNFEDTDNGTVPNFSPNGWNVISGRYFNSDPSAIEGSNVMLTTQNAEASQTISLPDGAYDFSGWLFPLDNAKANVSITLKSGSNTRKITLSNPKFSGYQRIENFAVAGGSVTVTLEAAFNEAVPV